MSAAEAVTGAEKSRALAERSAAPSAQAGKPTADGFEDELIEYKGDSLPGDSQSVVRDGPVLSFVSRPSELESGSVDALRQRGAHDEPPSKSAHAAAQFAGPHPLSRQHVTRISPAPAALEPATRPRT